MSLATGTAFPEGGWTLCQRRTAHLAKRPLLHVGELLPGLYSGARVGLLPTKESRFRMRYKLGAGAVPIKTEHGWPNLSYCSVSTGLSELKACLLDLEDPSKIIGYTRDLSVAWHDYEMRAEL